MKLCWKLTILVVIIKCCIAQDPCNSYTTINNPWRSIYNRDQSRNYCDQPGKTGAQSSYNKWFRFVGSGGTMMPETCPSSSGNLCGTDVTFWVNGRHPSLAEGTVTRQVSGGYSGTCYSRSYKAPSIRIKRCQQGFFVYYLGKVSSCSLAYCTANACSIRNGNCSHNCTDLPSGNIQCNCPPNMVLGSDAETCVNPCMVNNGNCSHTCTTVVIKGINGASCSCPPRMTLGPNGKTCVATCSINNGGCSHKCVNSDNGAICSCPDGIILSPDGATCAKPCDISNGFCSHICVNGRDRAICKCPPSLALKLDGKTCTNDFENTYRCDCTVHAEVPGVREGSILYDLPTLIYGFTNVWAEDANGTFRVVDRYPKFRSGSVLHRQKRQVDVHARECLTLYRNCPQDCEAMAKLAMGDGLSTVVTVSGSSGSRTLSIGQVMCERLSAPLTNPGRRPIIFYNPGPKCGRPASTHYLYDSLCCSYLKIPGLFETYVWDKKCDGKVSVKDIIIG